MQNFPIKIHSSSKSKGKRTPISLQSGYTVPRCKDCIELMIVLTPHFSSKMSDLAHCGLRLNQYHKKPRNTFFCFCISLANEQNHSCWLSNLGLECLESFLGGRSIQWNLVTICTLSPLKLKSENSKAFRRSFLSAISSSLKILK